MSPDSPELWLGLAALEERTGNFALAREAAERVLAWTVVNPRPQAPRARFIEERTIPGDAGYLGLSVGSDGTRVKVPPVAGGGCGGGGFSTLADSVPIPPSPDPTVNA